MDNENISAKISAAFKAVKQIYDETSSLMQHVEQSMRPEFVPPARSQYAYRKIGGYNWLTNTIARYLEMKQDRHLGVIVSVQYLPQAPLPFREAGPFVSAAALRLKEPLKGGDWSWRWIEDAGHNTAVFDIDEEKAPVYRSRPKPDAPEKIKRLDYVDVFWLPLDVLAGPQEVQELLVGPLKALVQGKAHVMSGPHNCYLTLD